MVQQRAMARIRRCRRYRSSLRAATGQRLSELRGHTARIEALAWGPNSKLASASMDGTVKLWDAAAGRELQTLLGHQGPVLCVAWSRNGERVLSGAADRTVRVWSSVTAKPEIILRASGAVRAVAWNSPNEELLAAIDPPEREAKVTVQRWSGTGEESGTATLSDTSVTSADWSSAGDLVVV